MQPGKCKVNLSFIVLAAIGAALAAPSASALPLSSAFSYQGQLLQNGVPATGPYHIRFELYDSIAAGNQLGVAVDLPAVDVNDGVFSVKLDFGVAPFQGERRFLRMIVDGTPLTPRQELTAVPYALYALDAPGGVDGAWQGNGSDLWYGAGGVGVVGASSPFPSGKGVFLEGGNASYANVFAYDYDSSQPLSLALNSPGGKVGIGTTTPTAKLDVVGNWDGDNGALTLRGDKPSLRLRGGFATDHTSWLMHVGSDGPGNLEFFSRNDAGVPGPGPWNLAMAMTYDGSVGIGMIAPTSKLEIAGQDALKISGHQPYFTLNDTSSGRRSFVQSAGGSLFFTTEGTTGFVTAYCTDFLIGSSSRRGAPGRALVDGGDTLVLNFANDWSKTRVDSLLQVKALQILGGADLAEPFDINVGAVSDRDAVQPGMVVVIDPANPGQLKLAGKAYDRGVAGIISGAGGVNPGVTLQQGGSVATGTQNVALTGRVYCWVDADANGPVEPSDLLTTSDTPGHAMKVTDHGRAGGAIIGKAMSRLDSGKGLVLVLVNLQ